jgi:hypothetical protein
MGTLGGGTGQAKAFAAALLLCATVVGVQELRLRQSEARATHLAHQLAQSRTQLFHTTVLAAREPLPHFVSSSSRRLLTEDEGSSYASATLDDESAHDDHADDHAVDDHHADDHAADDHHADDHGSDSCAGFDHHASDWYESYSQIDLVYCVILGEP